MLLYENSKLGVWLAANHPEAKSFHRGLRETLTGYEQKVTGYERIVTGHEQINIGTEEEPVLVDGPPIYGPGDPIYEDDLDHPIFEYGPDQYELIGWQEAWGKPPTEEELEAFQPTPTPPENNVTDVDIAKQYQQAYQAAEGIIFLLMGRVAPTLIQKKYFTEDTVNAEGTKFTKYHREVIQDFKNSGRHPDAGDEMYAAFVGSKETFPWVEDETILAIFVSTIPRNPT